MKGDFSRQTFDPARHYGGVLMQQGRVQLDADWNEQEAIGRRRAQVEARDVVGGCGGPRDDAGFAISLAGGKELQIGAGRYYVDGLLAENETDGLAYESQPDLPGPPDWLDALTKAKTTLGLAYLDVWERLVTQLDDPLIREVALGGPDTATRIKTVWQVRVLPLAPQGDTARLVALRQKRASIEKALGVATRRGNAAQVATLQQDLAQLDREAAALTDGPSCDSDFPEWDSLMSAAEPLLNARTVPPAAADGPCIVPPTSGYRSLENQLYRVEVHTPGALGTATFKWSRDNGTVVTSIEQLGGTQVVVHDLGPDDVLGFASGQWVEISDDAAELGGLPGQLAQIESVDPGTRTITLAKAATALSNDPSGVDRTRHPKLRRWDQSGDSATTSGVATASGWLPLEQGVEVQFQAGTFATGDYWLIPARTATGEIEWPPFAVPNTAPEPQPRRGIHHHYCRLALLSFDATAQTWSVVGDCRKLFDPLTVSCCDQPGALHVKATNWQNDDFFNLATLQENGLRITLDAPVDPATLTDDTVQVTIDAPYPPTSPTAGYAQRVFVHGTIGPDPNDPNTIVWRAQTGETTGAGGAAGAGGAVGGAAGAGGAAGGAAGAAGGIAGRFNRLNAVHLDSVHLASVLGARFGGQAVNEPAADAGGAVGVAATTFVSRAIVLRVMLHGRLIWSAASRASRDVVYLDGQAFGVPGVRSDGSPRIDLRLPSGDDATASDFESWMQLGVARGQAPLRPTAISFATADGRPSSAGTIAIPVTRDVFFKAGEKIATVAVTFSRPILDTSLGQGDAATLFVEQDKDGQRGRLVADAALVEPSVALLTLRDPSAFGAGTFVLTCKGTNADGSPGGILAADDSSPLDGNFDGQAGGDFSLTFSAQ